MARIYVASSWRNPHQPSLVEELRLEYHEVYDFRACVSVGSEPRPTSFKWDELSKDWKDWTPNQYIKTLFSHQRAAQGYLGDFRAMEWADTCVLCLPAGNSAHIEAGYMKGRGKRLIIYFQDDSLVTTSADGTCSWKFEPDLMYLTADNIVCGWDRLKEVL